MMFIKSEETQLVCAECWENDPDCEVHRLLNTDGEVLIRCYQVFPGITLEYHDIHARSSIIDTEPKDAIFEIRHCREGRMEGSSSDVFYYMEPGDLAICRPETECHCRYYPLSHYHGITITVDVKQAPHCLSCFLDDVNVQPELLMQKFCTVPAAFVARSQPSVEHIFSELYSVPAQIRKGYFKVKVLELFLFLACIDPHTDELARRSYSNNQRLLAVQISRYLTEHMDSRITLDQLADRFLVSATQIKSSVKSVYGTSVYNYIRMQKMQSAAKMLRDTELSVSEIAGRFGYDNASKFAGAFKTVMGTTPKEYRNAPIETDVFA